MVRRLVDVVLSAAALVLAGPLLALAAVGILLSDPGPVLHRARRAGLNGRVFSLYKFRTMRVEQGASPSAITAKHDQRVFRFGSWLRRLKIDELPQLVNILRGEMTFVGPRPEDPRIVGRYYTPEQLETLSVLPGLASPGSIYSYTHGEPMLCDDDTEACYAERLLPVKLALDTVYVREASPAYDLKVMLRAARVILGKAFGQSHFPTPPEMGKALRRSGRGLVVFAGADVGTQAAGTRQPVEISGDGGNARARVDGRAAGQKMEV